MTTYENAPATKMLNTHCCACGRPLVDAESVTAGLGPICRGKYGLPDTLDAETHARANKLIYLCAREDVTADDLKAAVVELSLLGCDVLAARIAKRAGRIVLTVTETGLDVDAPYSETFLNLRGLGRWVKDAKVTRYPMHAAGSALTAIRSSFKNSLVRFERDGEVGYFNSEDEDLYDIINELAGTEAAPAAGPEIKLAGSPSKTRSGAWGVQLPSGTPATAGDLAVVTTRGGKQWVARLKGSAESSKWGDVWATDRTDLAVPAETPVNPAPAATAQPAAPAAPAKPAVKCWNGSPKKIGAGWGVAIANSGVDQDPPMEGDRVRITTRGGKTWFATLAEDATLNKWGDFVARTR
jgi:hypothetical protein